jgi:hypothetical protein
MLALKDINFFGLFALKKNVDASIIPSNDAFVGIVFRCWVAFTKETKTPVFERHTALLIVVKAPMFLRANFFERRSEFSFEVFKFHVCKPMAPRLPLLPISPVLLSLRASPLVPPDSYS